MHIPYGVSLESFHPPAPNRERDDVFRIIQVGGVNLRKGCQYLLEAFAGLDLPDAELHFVGPVAPEMEPFRERHASDRVVFRGAVPQDALVAEYGRANVFCLASIQEGFGMVIAQAMACGLPVVATENTCAGDLLHEGVDGFVVPIRDPAALAEKLLWLYRNREACRAMGAFARERIEVGFSWQDYGARALRAYSRAVAAKERPSAGFGAEVAA